MWVKTDLSVEVERVVPQGNDSTRSTVSGTRRSIVEVRAGQAYLGETRMPMGSRALALLEVLLRANGELVTKDQILNEVWPDLIVEENNIQVQISTIRRHLGHYRDCLTTVSGRGYRLTPPPCPALPDASHAHDDQGALEAAAQVAVRSRAAWPGTSRILFGREEAIDQIRAAFDAHRLVTLTGAGGIGKTVLSLAVGATLRNAHARRVCFAELVSLSSAKEIEDALRRCIEEPLDSRIALSDVAPCLDRSIDVLVLDNAEHLIDDVARIVDVLLKHAQALKILVTSREPLSLVGESVVRVEPLPIPCDGASKQQLAACPAVALFVRQMSDAREPDSIDIAELSAIAEVCRRLDGIPLAIELAAARAKSLGVQGVRDRLHDRFDMLTNGRRNVVPHHKALRATFDWSYDLLDDTSQRLFCRLGVFSGAFSLEALCAVACDTHLPLMHALDAVGELVAKSLLNAEFDGPVIRYRLLESTRSYALERLAIDDDIPLIQGRRVRYVADHLAKCRDLEGGRNRIDVDEMRASSDWALKHDDVSLGVSITVGLTRALMQCGALEEAARRAEQALEAMSKTRDASQGGQNPREAMELRAVLALTLPHVSGASQRSVQLWKEVMHFALQCGDGIDVARASWGLWNAHMFGADIEAALEVANSLSRYANTDAHAWQGALAQAMTSVSLHCQGLHEAARHIAQRVLAHLEARADENDRIKAVASDPRAVCYSVLARIDWVQGASNDTIMSSIEKAIGLIDPVTMEPWLSHTLGMVAAPIAFLAGDTQRGDHYLRILRSQSSLHGFKPWQDYCECLSGLAAVISGDLRGGVSQLEQGLERLTSYGFRRFVMPFQIAYAEVLINTARPDAAIERLNGIREFCESHGEWMFVPEIERMLGLAWLAMALDLPKRSAKRLDHFDRAREAFCRAERLARKQDAHLFATRAASCMSNLVLAEQ